MVERKYSVSEINEMRDLVAFIRMELYGGVGAPDSIVENQLRTFMSNGTTAEELRSELSRITPGHFHCRLAPQHGE